MMSASADRRSSLWKRRLTSVRISHALTMSAARSIWKTANPRSRSPSSINAFARIQRSLVVPMGARRMTRYRGMKEAWRPMLAGEKFFLVAPWRKEPTPPGRFGLEINPGTQCGTGRHPCTQLCLAAMERMICRGDRVLDVGSGSGILSRAAKMLGAGMVVACDIDPEAAHEDPFFIGSVDAVRSGAFDLVVANISEIVTGHLKPEFDRVAS